MFVAWLISAQQKPGPKRARADNPITVEIFIWREFGKIGWGSNPKHLSRHLICIEAAAPTGNGRFPTRMLNPRGPVLKDEQRKPRRVSAPVRPPPLSMRAGDDSY